MMNRRTRREIAAPLFQDTPSLYAIHVAHLRLLRLRLTLPAPPHPTSTLQLIRPPSDDSPFFHVVHAHPWRYTARPIFNLYSIFSQVIF